MADDAIKNQVREASDIVEVASRYLRLKKSGKDHVALCPFHREKTPSFHINTQGQYYYCFGCGKKGDVFTLVMEMEAMTFPEALAMLAGRAGIDIHKGRSTEEIEHARKIAAAKDALYKMMAEADAFFEGCLYGETGRKALEYAVGRKFTGDTMKAFGLGYAPDSWDALRTHLNHLGANDKWLEKAGLARQGSSGSYYDYFRNRLMFPIRNGEGKVIGFGARALEKDDEPKYLNSPDTPVFKKGVTLFGLDRARRAINASGNIVIVEGYTDVMMSHQVGIENTVATLGTAVTRENAVLLGRLAEKVTLVFDGDEAGRKACRRGLEVLIPLGTDTRVVMLPVEEDPCSLVAAGREQEYKDAIDGAVDGLKWWLDAVGADADAKGPLGRMHAANRAAAVLDDATDVAVKQTVLGAIAQHFGVDVKALRVSAAPRTQATEAQMQRLTVEDAAAADVVAKAALAPAKAAEAAAELEGVADPDTLQLLRRIADIARNGFSGREVLDQMMSEGVGHGALVEAAAQAASTNQSGHPAAALANAVLYHKRAILKKRYKDLSSKQQKTADDISTLQQLRREIDTVEAGMQKMQGA